MTSTLAERLAALHDAAQFNARFYALDTSGSLRTRIGGAGSGMPGDNPPAWDDLGGYSTSLAVSRRGTIFTTGTRWAAAKPTLFVGRGGADGWQYASETMLDAKQVCIAERPYGDTLLVAAIGVPPGTVRVQLFNDAPGVGETESERWTVNNRRWGDHDVLPTPAGKQVKRLGARPNGGGYLLYALCWNDDNSLTLSVARFVPGAIRDAHHTAWSDVTTVSAGFISSYFKALKPKTQVVSKYSSMNPPWQMTRGRVPTSISFLPDGTVVLHVCFGVWLVPAGQTRGPSNPDWNLLEMVSNGGMHIQANHTPHNFTFFSDLTSALLTDRGLYVRFWDLKAWDFRWRQDLAAEGAAIQKQSYDEFPVFQALYGSLNESSRRGTA
ncbi:MAG TPA: hypothetical protein VF006_23165 [Longimicrobium sp.]